MKLFVVRSEDTHTPDAALIVAPDSATESEAAVLADEIHRAVVVGAIPLSEEAASLLSRTSPIGKPFYYWADEE